MKKNPILFVATLLSGVGLFLYRLTNSNVTLHIVIAVVGLVLIGVSTIKEKDLWNNKPVELLLRIAYVIAIITGFILKNGTSQPVHIVHVVAAALFVILLIVSFIVNGKKK